MKKKEEVNKTYLLKVSGGEDFGGNSEFALIELTPKFLELVNSIRRELLNIKKKIDSSVYDIRIFSYEPAFLAYGEVDKVDSDEATNALDDALDQDIVIISPKLVKELDEAEIVRTEVVMLHVGEDSFNWTGVYKHTDIEFRTESIKFKNL